ncbi:MAG: TonB-dependent receptor [Cyanobacteria bacterium J06649_11]
MPSDQSQLNQFLKQPDNTSTLGSTTVVPTSQSTPDFYLETSGHAAEAESSLPQILHPGPISSSVERFTQVSVEDKIVASSYDAIEIAQEEDDVTGEDVTEDNEILRIIVTSERVEEDIQDIPGSVTAITEQEFEDSGIRSPQEVSRLVPNFSTFANGPRSNNPVYNIRGLANDLNVVGIGQSSVGIYIDDVPVDILSSETALYDIERIEILRGPQGTLYGRNSQGGVVNILTKAPDDFFRFNSLATLGTENLREAQLSASGPINDELFFSLGGSYFESDGFIDNVFLDEDADERQNYGFRGQLRWVPSEQWDVRLGADYEEFDDGSTFGTFVDADDSREVEENFLGFNEVERNSQFLRARYAGSDIVVTSISGRRQWDQENATDSDFSSLDATVGGADVETVQYTQELRIQSSPDNERWRWLLGGFLEHEDSELSGGVRTVGPAGANPAFGLFEGSSFTNFGDLDDTTYAVFAQSSYDFTDQLGVTAGLRFEHRDFSMDRRSRLAFNGVEIAPVPDYSVDASESILLPKFAIEYRFRPGGLAYASVSRGYKPGGFNIISDAPEAAEFDSETSLAYEVGVKTSWLDNRLLANLALFKTDLKDYQVVGFDLPNLVTTVLNAASADIWGVELDLRVKPTDRVDLIASFGYLNTEFNEFTDSITGRDLSGNQLPNSPEYTYALAAQYRDPGGLFGRLELSGFGTYVFDQTNDAKQDPFLLVNARVGYEFDDFGVYIYGNNLFNQNYFTSALNSGTGRFVGYPGEGSTFGLQVRGKF